MLKRAFGNTNEQLSILGFGGIMVMNTDPVEAAQLVKTAILRGVNYFDVAPGYGNAEELLGPALQPFRNEVFLACKTGKRRADEATEELHRSLKRMRTDCFDLYQLHGMSTEEDFQQATGPGGALEAFVKARDDGLVRYLGFSAHSDAIALKLLDYFDFDSVLFPVNWVSYLTDGFGRDVVVKAESKGAARLALKAFARSRVEEGAEKQYGKRWYHPITDSDLASLAFRFALSQPVTAALPPGAQELFPMALNIAENFEPITEAEISFLKHNLTDNTPLFRTEITGGFQGFGN